MGVQRTPLVALLGIVVVTWLYNAALLHHIDGVKSVGVMDQVHSTSPAAAAASSDTIMNMLDETIRGATQRLLRAEARVRELEAAIAHSRPAAGAAGAAGAAEGRLAEARDAAQDAAPASGVGAVGVAPAAGSSAAGGAPAAGTAQAPAARAGALGESTALLIIAHNRSGYLKRCLDAVLKHYGGEMRVPVLVSVDGDFPKTRAVFDAAKEAAPGVPMHYRQHSLTRQERGSDGYQALAAHFRHALTDAFDNGAAWGSAPVERVILLEEDLEVSPDFFEWFAATAPLLDADEKLMAVSAWNDNGQGAFVRDPRAAYRSDFFPGLGWMMPRRIWEELGPKWPRGYWDDWLREPAQRRGRHFLRPEVCRTFHFGEKGTSNMQYGEALQRIRAATAPVDWRREDLGYLATEQQWDAFYLTLVKQAPLMTEAQLREAQAAGRAPAAARVAYSGVVRGPASFAAMAPHFGIMDNEKAGVPRTAYKGVVSFWLGETKVHLVPA